MIIFVESFADKKVQKLHMEESLQVSSYLRSTMANESIPSQSMHGLAVKEAAQCWLLHFILNFVDFLIAFVYRLCVAIKTKPKML